MLTLNLKNILQKLARIRKNRSATPYKNPEKKLFFLREKIEFKLTEFKSPVLMSPLGWFRAVYWDVIQIP